MNYVKAPMVLSLLLLICLPASGYSQSTSMSDVRSYCRVTTSGDRSTLDRRTMITTSTATVTITNISSRTILTPFHAVIDILSNTGPVTMPAAAGGTGTQPYGKYYYDLASGSLADGRFAPGESIAFLVTFARKSTVTFRYNVIPYGILEPVNQPPVANAGSNQTLILMPGESAISAQLDGSQSRDPDGTIGSYRWSGAPTPAATARPSVSLSPGTYTFTLVVTDTLGANSAPASVTVIVKRASPPQVSVDLLVFPVKQGETLIFSVSALSPDGRSVTLSAGPAINNAAFSVASAAPGSEVRGSFAFSPDSTQSGRYLVNFKARDSIGLVHSKTVQILVNTINHRPEITLPLTATVNEGKPLVISVVASDPDGDILSLSATGLPSTNAVFVPSSGTITFLPDYTQSGTYNFSVTASDGALSSSSTIQVTVNDVPTGDGTGTAELKLNINPVESPTFLKSQKITGTVNMEGSSVVQPFKSALITGMTPVTAEQGSTLDVMLTGDSGNYATHFANGISKAIFGDGITVNSIAILGPTQVTANVSIDAVAVVGPRPVNVVTGSETAVSVLAFNILRGKTRISGRIVDAETGLAVASATISIQGTSLTTQTDTSGYFTLTDAPSGAQTLIVNSADHDPIVMSLAAQTGLAQDLGEIKTASNAFNPSAPSGASLGSLLSRVFTNFKDKRTAVELEQTVIDAVQYVGGRDLGVLDEYGNELNPKVQETPFLRLKSGAVSTIAMRMKTDAPATLGELLWQFTQLFRWREGTGYLGKPTLAHWINALQQTVNTAWAKPNDPASRLFILLFNNGTNLAPQPPRIAPDLPLNALQASLLRFSLLATGARAIDPDDIFSQLPADYFSGEQEIAANLQSKPVLFAGLMKNLSDSGHSLFESDYVSDSTSAYFSASSFQEGTGKVLIAKAARSKENAYIGKDLMLDGTSSSITSGLRVIFEWTVTSQPADSTGNLRFRYGNTTLVESRKRVVFFNPDQSGEYKIQLVLKTEDGTMQSDPYEITVVARHWPCDPRGLDPEWEDTEVVNLDRPWQNVLCTMGSNNAVDILKTELGSLVSEFNIPEVPQSAYEEWASKGTIAGDVTSRLKAENNFMRFFQNDAKYSATLRSYAQAYEKYLPEIMESAKEEPPSISSEIKGMVVKELVTGTLSYFKDQADKLGESIMYAFLDKTINDLINGLRPSPPTVLNVDVMDAGQDSSKKIALVYFNRSAEDPGPDGKAAICAGLDPNDTSAAAQKSRTRCNSDFYYRLVREHSNEVSKYSFLPEGTNVVNGPVPTGKNPGGEPLFFVDYNPPEGQVRYYVQARRIIGKHTVPSTTMWSDAEFFLTNYVIGGVCPPAAAQYNFSKGLMERFLKIFSETKLQDSDLGEPEMVYVPRPFERQSPPVSLATDASKRVSVSVPLASSVFSLKGGNLEYAFNTGFKDPYQVGLAIDSLGYFYSVNAASEDQFGGRIFRWKPLTYEREFFGAMQYYSLDLGYAQPSAAQSMYAGMSYGQEKLFATDLYNNSLRYLSIPPNGALPPGDLLHNVMQPLAQSPTITPTAQSSMTIRQGMDLLMTQNDNIFRYSKPEDNGMMFDSYKPFLSLAGIDGDIFGNLYVADAGSGPGNGTITALPLTNQNNAFYQALINNPGTRSLYTLVGNLDSPGDLRVGGQGSALVWFDRNGFNSRQFGLSARILDESTGAPLSFALVSAEGNGITTDGQTDENGVVHLPGFLTPTSQPPSVSLLIRDTFGRTMTVRINSLVREGETFIDPLIFSSDVIPAPPSVAPPPTTPPVPVTLTGISITNTGIPSAFITQINPGGLPPISPPAIPSNLATARAPKLELVAPVDGLQTAGASVEVVGVVNDPMVTLARLVVNGVEQEVAVSNGRFSGSINLNSGINSISASASITIDGQTLTGSSGVAYVQRTDAAPAKGALSGIVLDRTTGYPVANVRVMIQRTGLYAYTDAMGVWFIENVPNGTYAIDIVP
jgi:hypothetical protein